MSKTAGVKKTATHGLLSPAAIAVLAPILFVVLWSSGYIVAKLAAPNATPLWFLCIRFFSTCCVLLPIILCVKAPWPKTSQTKHLIVSGALIHAGYLAGVWVAVRLGMPAALSALIVNLQPILTAAAGPWMNEKVSSKQWFGLILGFVGVSIVVAQRSNTGDVTGLNLALCIGALLAITAGTLYQKRFTPNFDLRTGTVIQYAASTLILLPFALWFEASASFNWVPSLWFAWAWSVFALSIGAIFLMFWLIANGAATATASLFFLVPPVTSLMAWILFDEPFGYVALGGMVLTAVGVTLVQRK